MAYDVVVVGGGVGGLTVAALLSARGVRTCLLERQAQVGGCIGRVTFGGYDFEPGIGLYTSWGNDELYARLFSELPVECPSVTRIDDEYLVRMGMDIPLERDDEVFYAHLREAFPECSQASIHFYEEVGKQTRSWLQQSQPTQRGLLQRLRSRFVDNQGMRDPMMQTAQSFASQTSPRFQRFIDAQLGALLQTSLDRCAFLPACLALNYLRSQMYSIEGGVTALAERLAESIKRAGGSLRLNSPVLRLAYNETGDAVGVDLLSGERVLASSAIISNLTIWDTYGKLVGLNRTPSEIKSQLANKQSSGVYIIYALLDDAAAERLPGRNFLVAGESSTKDSTLSSEFTVSIGPGLTNGKWPVTIKAGTGVSSWFAFHTSEEDFEQREQEILEDLWARLHRSVPELGAGIEVIETANPRSFYDLTRRKLGMVMGFETTPDSWSANASFTTSVPNLFVVGDTVTPTFGVSGVASSALQLANQLTK